LQGWVNQLAGRGISNPCGVVPTSRSDVTAIRTKLGALDARGVVQQENSRPGFCLAYLNCTVRGHSDDSPAIRTECRPEKPGLAGPQIVADRGTNRLPCR